MVGIEQQCSCLHPLVWIGCKLLTQLPKPAPGSKTSTGPCSELERRQWPRLLVSGQRPASVVRRSLLCRMMTQRRERTQISFDSSLERGGGNWSRRSKVAPPCRWDPHRRPLQREGQAAEGSSTKPSVGVGCRGRPSVTRTARGASMAKETCLCHIIPCFQHVSICNFDVSLQFLFTMVAF